MMREALTANYPVGNDRFREEIMKALGRPIGQAKRGRPARSRSDES